ncbi:MAG: class I tRNA ligase family protein, partial [Polyangiales bacterium]
MPIFPSPLADPEKGTGILMVCTFGDATDVQWWREHGLALRQVLGRDGRFVPVDFSAAPFESQRPELAARFYAELCGKTVFSARGAIVQALRQPEGASAGHEAPLSCEPKPVEQAVKFFEKGDRPLEFITTRQWFVRLLPHKAALLAQGEKIQWHPPFMGVRYQNWTENLSLDWCISRQRYFGVPFPLWYPLDEAGQLRFEAPILASEAQLPVDPMASPPPGMQEAQRGQPGGFVGEADVFDTWFTSSLSPQLSSHWGLDQARHARLFPADMRPQSHEIIRTWAFYTIAKAWLHEGQLPWQHVVVSGWVLDPDRKKMSKSKGNVITPLHLLDEHGSDAVRYWAASARLGTDTAFDPKVLKIGRRLVTKLYNAGKFVLQHPAPPDSTLSAIQHPLDQAFVAALRALVTKATADQKAFEFAKALLDTEQFFWRHFTDSYL